MNERRDREALLDELQGIVMSEGFAHWKMGELAERLHCSRSTLYKLAPSKDELVLLVVMRLVGTALEGARRAATTSPMTSAERIVTYVESVRMWLDRISPQLWVDLDAHPHVADLFGRREGVADVRVYIEEGVASGEFRPVNTEYTSRLLIEGVRLAQDPEVQRASGVDASKAIRILIDVLLKGIACER